MTPISRPSPRAWLVVALLWFVGCSNFAVRVMVTTMHGSLTAAFPITETQFGLLTSVFLWVYGSVSPIAGFLSDRFHRSRVIIISMFVWSTITWLTSYAKTFEQLVILRGLMGLSEASYIPAALALISDYHRRPTRSLATAIHQTGMAIGTALGGLGGWLAEQRSWHYAFSLVGLAGMAYCGVLLLFLREAPPGGPAEVAEAVAAPKARFTKAVRTLLICGSFILALLSWAMVGIYGWTVGGWLPVFLQEHFRIGQGEAGLFGTSYSAVVGAVGMLFGGAWADRWGRRNGRAPMFVPAIGLLVATPCLILTANCGIFALVVGAIILYRFFSGFIDSNMMPILCEIIDRRYRATAYGLLNTVGVIAGGLGIYGAGVLRDRKIDLSVVFDLVAVTMVLCSVFLFFMKPRSPGRAGDKPAVPIRAGAAGSLPARMNPDPKSVPRAISAMPPSPARTWLVVALLWFVVCSNFLARLMLTTMHGSILASIPMTETQFGLLTSILLCTYGLVSPFAGFLADRFGRSRVIIVSMATWSTITWLTSYAKSFEQLLILRTLMGLSEACYLPAGLAMVSDYHRTATRSLATGVHQSGMYTGMALAGLGGWLAERHSWHYAFSLVGLVGIGYAALLVLFLRDTPGEGRGGTSADLAEPKARFGEGLARLFSRGSFVLVVITWGMLGTISWSVYGWMPLFLQEHFHLGQGIAGLSATFYSNLAAMPGLLLGGVWSDRWSRRNHRARVLVATFGLLLAAPSILLTARTGILALAILGVIFYRLFTAFLDSNMMPILCEIIDRRYRATAYGLLNLTGVFGAGLGLYFAGVLRDRKIDLSVVYTVVAGLTALGSAMFFFVRPRMPAAPGGVLAARTLGQKRSH